MEWNNSKSSLQAELCQRLLFNLFTKAKCTVINSRFDLRMNILWFYFLFEQNVFTQPFKKSHLIKAKEWKTSFRKMKELLVPVIITGPITECVEEVRLSPRTWEPGPSSPVPEGTQTPFVSLQPRPPGCQMTWGAIILHCFHFELYYYEERNATLFQLEQDCRMEHTSYSSISSFPSVLHWILNSLLWSRFFLIPVYTTEY